MNITDGKTTPQNRTYTVEDIAVILGIGRSSAYKLAKSGYFKIIRIGNMIRISRKSFEEWLARAGAEESDAADANKKAEKDTGEEET